MRTAGSALVEKANSFPVTHTGLFFGRICLLEVSVCSVAMSLAASVLVLLLAGLYAADARSAGAPPPACATLSPDSPHPADGQTTPVPYEIDLTVFEDNGTLQYNPGRVYTRTLPSILGSATATLTVGRIS